MVRVSLLVAIVTKAFLATEGYFIRGTVNKRGFGSRGRRESGGVWCGWPGRMEDVGRIVGPITYLPGVSQAQ